MFKERGYCPIFGKNTETITHKGICVLCRQVCLSFSCSITNLLSPLYTSTAWRGAEWLNQIEIMEVVHCLYICAARQLSVCADFSI